MNPTWGPDPGYLVSNAIVAADYRLGWEFILAGNACSLSCGRRVHGWASILCGHGAYSTVPRRFARILQGIGGGAMQPIAQGGAAGKFFRRPRRVGSHGVFTAWA